MQVIFKVIDVCSWYWKPQAHAIMWSHSSMQPSTPLTSVHELLYYTCTIFMQEMNILLDNVTSRTRMEALELYLHTSLTIETNNDVVSTPLV